MMNTAITKTSCHATKGISAQVRRACMFMLLSFGFAWTLQAQVSSYTFSQATNTYTPLVGGTIAVASAWDDAVSAALPISFTFTFNGVGYTSCFVNSNGYITFGTASTSTQRSPISVLAGGPAISALGRDLQDNTASPQPITYGIEGVSPSRVFVVQWTNCRRFTGTGDIFNFQIRLYETSNVAEVRYGTNTATSTSSITSQVGLRGLSTADFNNRSTTTNWSATTAGGSNTASCTITNLILPPSGLSFVWTPLAFSCSSPGVPGNLSSSSVTATTASINWTAGGAATGYDYEVRTSGACGSGATGLFTSGSTAALTQALTGLTPSTTYTYCVRSTCSGNVSAFVSGTFTTPAAPPANDLICNAVAVTCGSTVSGTTVNATNSGTGENITCTVSQSQPGVWYTIVGTGGSIQASLCGTVWDSKISVFSGPSCAGPLTCVGGNDDGGVACTGSSASFAWPSTPGLNYYILVHGFSSTSAFSLAVTCPTPPSCVTAPTAPADGATGQISSGITLSWPAVSGATGYNVYFGTSTPAPTLVSTNQAGTTYATGALSPFTTYYWRIEPRNSAGIATGCSNWSFTSGVGVICSTGLYTTGCTSNDYIDNISISNLTQTATGCTPGLGIADFQNLTVNFQQSVTYPYSITCPFTSGERTGVWIDFNDNGSFADAGEFIGSTPASTSSNITGSVTIPLSAPLGNHRMRVRLVFGTDQSLTTSCTTYTFGETHDYTANIAPPPACPAVTGLASSAVAPASATVSWTAAPGAVSYDYEVRTSGACGSGATGLFTSGNTTGTSLNLTGLAQGTAYTVCVVSNCGINAGTAVSTTFTTTFFPPANDLICNAISIGCGGTLNGTTVNATMSGTGEGGTCGTSQSQPGVWYTVVGTGQGMIASLCGTSPSWDSKLSVFSGASCAGPLTCIGGQDDSGPACTGLQSSFGWLSSPGVTYYILVHGFSSTSAFTLNLSCINAPGCVSAPTAPANGATNEAVAGVTLSWPAVTGATGYDVYFGTTPVPTGLVSNNQTGLTYATGALALGTTYYWRIEPRNAGGPATGCSNFSFSTIPAAANDLCANAIPLACGATVTGSTSNATSTGETTLPTACGANTSITAPGVWYSILGNGQPMTLTTCNAATNYDTKLHVFSGSCLSPVCVTNNDDDLGCTSNSLRSTVTWNSVFGTTYLVLVDGFSSATGNFGLSLTCSCTPISYSSTKTDLACAGANTGTIDFGVPTGGVAPYQYSIDGGATFQSSPNFTGLAAGTYVRNVRDVNGCLGTPMSITLVVLDATAPIIDCGPNPTVNLTTDPGMCSAVYNYSVLASDNCGTVTVVQTSGLPSGSSFSMGTTINAFQATDGNGNVAACTFTVVVTDGENPTLSCPAPISVNTNPGQCTGTATFATPTAADNCPGVSTSQTGGTASGGAFALGANTVTFTATDNAGNTAACSFVVTVTDAEAPVAICPSSNITVSNDPGVCGAAVTYASGCTDNCSCTSTASTASGSVFSIGNTVVTVTATDGSGNTSTCNFTVTVNDTEAPVLTCSPDVTVNNDPGQCGAIVFYPVSVTDNCPNPGFTGWANGMFFNVGTANTVVIATDASGNTSSCAINITVIDNQAPTASCPANITVANAPGQCSANVSYSGSASDNCTASLSFDIASGSSFNVGTTTVTGTATDPSGNTATCSFTVTVNDAEAPSITCPANIVGNTDPGVCGRLTSWGPIVRTDNCPGTIALARIQGPANNTVFPVGNTTVVFRATDVAGNTSTCAFTVTVNDNQAPTISCPANINVSADPGLCSTTVNYSATASDNCAAAVSYSRAPGVFNLGLVTVTATATDPSGNTATCSFTVNVNDTQAPTVTCSNITVNLSGNTATIAPSQVGSGTDNCSGVLIQASQTSFSCSNVGANTVTVTALDIFGNASTCTAIVTVRDVTAPTAVCQNINFNLSNGTTLNASQVDGGSSDNCGITSRTVTPNSFNCSNIGVNNVTLTVADPSGNTSSCNATVTIAGSPTVVTITSPLNSCGYNVSACCGNNGSGGSGSDGSGHGSGSGDQGSGRQHGSGRNGGHFGPGSNCGRDGCVTATVSGGCGITTYTYLWSNGATSASQCGLTPGLYRVTVTDASGGTYVQSIVLTQTPTLAVTATATNISCYGQQDGSVTANVSGGCGPFTYRWSGNRTGQTISGLNQGNYTVTVTAANGCTATATATVTRPSRLNANAGANQVVYPAYGPQSCVTLTGSASGGTPAYSMQWTNRAGNVLSSGNSVSVCPTVSTAYFFRVTDARGCTALDSVLVCARNVSCGANMIQICHRPPGTRGAGTTQCVPLGTVAGHLAHGDYIGACNSNYKCDFPKGRNAVPVAKSDEAAGAFDQGMSFSVQTYPNPSNGRLTVELACMGCADEAVFEVTVTDLVGKVLLTTEMPTTGGEGALKLDLTQFSNGTYLVVVKDGASRHVSRIVKQ